MLGERSHAWWLFLAPMDSSLPLEAAAIAARPARALYRYSILVVVWCFFQINTGAMVTSTNSGMAFEDWPLSDGYWLWPIDMGELPKFFEYFHRLWGATLGILTIGLLVWVWAVDPRRWMRGLMVAILILVVVQGVVGGTGVLEKLPAVNSVTHGVLAATLLSCLTFAAFCLSGAWRNRVACDPGMVRTARGLAVVALALVILQSVVGAILRHTNSAYALWSHVGFAMVVSLAILLSAAYSGSRFAGVQGFRQLSRITLGILLAQLVLGFVTLAVRNPKQVANAESAESLSRAAVQSVHVLLGATLLLVASLLVARAYRNLAPRLET